MGTVDLHTATSSQGRTSRQVSARGAITKGGHTQLQLVGKRGEKWGGMQRHLLQVSKRGEGAET